MNVLNNKLDIETKKMSNITERLGNIQKNSEMS